MVLVLRRIEHHNPRSALMLAVTHSGKFHGDDVVAWALLKLYHPEELSLLLAETQRTGTEQISSLMWEECSTAVRADLTTTSTPTLARLALLEWSSTSCKKAVTLS